MKLILSIVLITFTTLLGAATAYAQTGSLKGTIVDKETGETLPGASIFLEGTTTGANTDFDGNFSINKIPVGKYRVMVSMVSFSKKAVNDVEIKAGEVTKLNVSMEVAKNNLTEVVIEAEAKRESLNALLIQQKNAVSVSDGISAESIKKTPDRNTSDVLKRVSGASIQDNKFAVVRGLNDRYNAAYINGAPLPSSESDRKAFSFDIFPSNMLDNLVINKTATPDMPAEFAGGIIQINTKSIPEENFQSFSMNGAYNTMTTGKEQLTYKGGKTDWLGIDDGSRSLPKDFPETKDFPSLPSKQAALAKDFNSNWQIDSKKFSPNQSYQYAMGHTFRIKDRDVFGMVLSASYNRSNLYQTTVRKTYSGNDIVDVPSQLETEYLDKTYATQTLVGALANFTAKINSNNTISFKNVFSINSDDRVITREGTPTVYDANPILLKSTVQWFTSNKIYSGQLGGDHAMAKGKLKISWLGSYSDIERSIPNLRRMIYTKNKFVQDENEPNPKDTMYVANITSANIGTSNGGGMFFSNNHESIYSGKTDISYQFNLGPNVKNTIKAGASYQYRDREFKARQIGYATYSKRGKYFCDSLLYLDQNQIFDQQNMGVLQTDTNLTGFKLRDATKLTDGYKANSKLQATYLMMDTKIGKVFRMIYGARLEDFTQVLTATLDNKDTLNILNHKLDILPSVNTIFSITEKQNIRACFSQTVNRPEFRELAPFAFYDFNTQYVFSGYDSLQRALINNYDLRYEFYPGRGQMISASTFYKTFSNPIEQISRDDVTREVSFRNAKSATNYGFELEFRTIIGALLRTDSSKFLNNITLFSNFAYIVSSVDINITNSANVKSRPLQGQSPYIFNAGLSYVDQERGYSFSASVNRVGQRIFIVGNVNDPTVWENGRTVLDLQIGKSFFKKKLDIKLFARDILAQNLYFYSDKNLNSKFDKTTDDIIWQTKLAPTYTLSLSLNF